MPGVKCLGRYCPTGYAVPISNSIDHCQEVTTLREKHAAPCIVFSQHDLSHERVHHQEGRIDDDLEKRGRSYRIAANRIDSERTESSTGPYPLIAIRGTVFQ
jgi:hypothetical protein